jgi:phage tail-like protein
VDANGTRLKTVLGRDDWSRWTTAAGVPLPDAWLRYRGGETGTAWDESHGELTLAALPWTFPPAPDARTLRREQRRGAAMDRYGNWYWIDPAERAILVTSSGSGATTAFWPAAGSTEPQPRSAEFRPAASTSPASTGRLRGLAVTADHYLLVGTLDRAGLLVFDLRTGGPPLVLEWPAAVAFAPFDIAPRPEAGAYILDRGDVGRARVWRLDRRFMVEGLGPAPDDAALSEPTFMPAADGAAREPAARSRAVSAADAVEIAGDPIAIAVPQDDLVVLLDPGTGGRSPALRLYSAAMRELDASPRELAGLDAGRPVHDMAALRPGDDSMAGVLADVFVVDVQGDQAYRFVLREGPGPLVVEPEYHPIRLFGGRGLVATNRGVWYDFGDRWVPLVAQRRPRYAESAVILSDVFDGITPGCVWHRLLLDGCLTPEARVRIWSAASDERANLEGPTWRAEPEPYRRGDGPERPFVPVPQDPRYGTHELLFQAARGRYLRLKIEMTGNRQISPRIRSVRAYYPRFSYLEQYLPRVYREDRASAGFLDAFLANLEGTLTVIEDRIAAAEMLFDPKTAPPEALDWLASWFDIVLDPGWDEDRRRLLIRHAVELFRWRGTERGLVMALGLALLRCPGDELFADDAEQEPGGIRIIERFQTKRVGAPVAGDPTIAALPRALLASGRWTPTEGGAALNARWASLADELAGANTSAADARRQRAYPLASPAPDLAITWRAFSERVLGFVPSATGDDRGRWAAFLARRYLRLDAFNRAYQRFGAAALGRFEDAVVPKALPSDGAPLADWYQFETVVMRGLRAAHRFSVLLPVPIGRDRGAVVRASDARGRAIEQARARRLVELEKPAHTVFDIRSYWLAFRVGEARLGKDTEIDYGSRSPDLRPPAVLGAMHVGEGVLTSEMTDVPERDQAFSGSVDATTRRLTRRTDD